MGWCTHVLRSYCGPLITVAVGVGFILVGAVPVAVAYALGPTSSSATIIGVGFVGFGVLVVLPGVAWCVVRRLSALRCCRCRRRHRLRPPAAHDDESFIDGGVVAAATGIHRHLATLSGSVVCCGNRGRSDRGYIGIYSIPPKISLPYKL